MSTRYLDTRGLDDSRPAFSDVVIKGIAAGGGLYVPETLPTLALDEILALAGLPYSERAARVFDAFGVDFSPERVAELMAQSFGANFDHPGVAPVVEPVAGVHVLELWHGPTSAFKDMALQCMPLFFSEAIAMRRATGAQVNDFLVLVATSGDTGKAALEGFADRATRASPSSTPPTASPTSSASRWSPSGAPTWRSSACAATSTTASRPSRPPSTTPPSTPSWPRVAPRAVVGQLHQLGPAAAADRLLRQRLRRHGRRRRARARRRAGRVRAHGQLRQHPGAYYAKRIGVPIGRLLCATNENNVLADFIATGVYDIASRPFVTTPSPSMDILISSNLERLLFELGRDAERVRGWMAELNAQGRFVVDEQTFAAVREHLAGDYVTNDESLQTIRRVYGETGLPARSRTPRSPGRWPSGCAVTGRCSWSRPPTGPSSAPTCTAPSKASPATAPCPRRSRN